MLFSPDYVLWRIFHDGLKDVEDVIEAEWQNDYARHGHQWNPKLEDWVLCARDWLNSERYEKDREAYKRIYDTLKNNCRYYEEDKYFNNFYFSVDFSNYHEDDIEVTIRYDLIVDHFNNTQELYIEGTRDTIVEEINKALSMDPVFPMELKYSNNPS